MLIILHTLKFNWWPYPFMHVKILMSLPPTAEYSTVARGPVSTPSVAMSVAMTNWFVISHWV